MSDAIKAFSFVWDNSQKVLKQINLNVYKILGISTNSEKLEEYIMGELENFDFHRIESNLMLKIKEVINDALKPLENPNENNYEAITNDLINKLKELKMQDFVLDSNFKELSSRIVSRFPSCGITQEQFYLHFSSKIGEVNEMIKTYNNEVIDTLIRFSPQLISEIQQSRTKKVSNVNVVNNQDNDSTSDSDISEYRENKQESKEPNDPSPVSTYIGATNEEIENLIKNGKYFSVLQGIKKEDTMKYSVFINTGYNFVLRDYYARASACQTYEEKHNAYFELYNIYQNFRNYISIEQSAQLKETLNNMLIYLQEQNRQEELIGVRYNNGTEKRSPRRM